MTLTRLGKNHPWGRGVKFVQINGERLSPRGDNGKGVKNTLNLFFFIFFYRTSLPNLIKFNIIHP
jgi:hypothetical protein